MKNDEEFSDRLTNASIESFCGLLTYAWKTISREHDVLDELPDIQFLLRGTELFDPAMAAETIVMNMLTEVTQMVDRFSPWYTRPARSFGLISYRDIITHNIVWKLAPEALDRWKQIIDSLIAEITRKGSLIEMFKQIDTLVTEDQYEGDSVLAICECNPPKELLVKQSFLRGSGIQCNECLQTFLPLAG